MAELKGKITPSIALQGRININTVNSGIDTSDADAAADDIAKDKTGYVDGEKVTGNVEERNATALTVTLQDNQIKASATKGIYRTNANRMVNPQSLDNNLQPENILADTTIMGVNGNYKALEHVSVLDAGYSADGELELELYDNTTTDSIYPVIQDANFIPENIKAGVDIFGMAGSFVPSFSGIKYRYGSFVLNNDCDTVYRIEMEPQLDFTPACVFMWTDEYAPVNAKARVAGFDMPSLIYPQLFPVAISGLCITNTNTLTRYGSQMLKYTTINNIGYIEIYGTNGYVLYRGWKYNWLAIGGTP